MAKAKTHTKPKTKKPDGRRNNGRPLGAVNRLTKEAIEMAKQTGELPLEYMLRVMRDDETPADQRDDMAKAAASYVHHRLQAMSVSGEVQHLTHEQALAQLR
jgi:hypothetical protein